MIRKTLTILSLIGLTATACDPCLSQCELALDICLEKAFEEFDDFSTTRERWLGELSEFGCDDSIPFLVAGECSSHSGLFLFRGGGFTTMTHYFDPDTEQFISLTTGTDVIGPICLGVGYWPEHLECSNAVVTEVLCGTQIEVGDSFGLP